LDQLFEVIQQKELHQWTDKEIIVTIKELAEPLITVALRDRLNHTYNGLSGQPIAIVAIPPRPTPPLAAPALPPAALAPPPAALLIPPAIPTAALPVIPIAAPPATPIAAPPATPIAAPPATPIAAPATPTTPPGPPPAQYLHSSTANTDLATTLPGT